MCPHYAAIAELVVSLGYNLGGGEDRQGAGEAQGEDRTGEVGAQAEAGEQDEDVESHRLPGAPARRCR